MGFKELREKLKWADPFTYIDLLVIPRVHALSPLQQNLLFVASYVLLSLLVYAVLGLNTFFFVLLAAFYVYLYFFERKEAVDWGIYLFFAFLFAWIIYGGAGLVLGTASPMVIVVSGSMEPVYHRGDVIVLQGASYKNIEGLEVVFNEQLSGKPFSVFAEPEYALINGAMQIKSIKFSNGETLSVEKNGSVIVYFSERMQEPIIHRVVAKISAADGGFFLTKGDSVNNNTVDQDCGRVIYGQPEKQCIKLYPVSEQEVQGRTILQVPIIGCIKLWLFDNLGSLIVTGALPRDFKGIC